MNDWAPDAHRELCTIADELRRSGLIDLLHATVGRVWRYNVDRYAPDDIGDTSRSLGVTASENIRSLVLRELASERPQALPPEIRADGADNSLLIRAQRGVRLRVIKAPVVEYLKAPPKWDEWEWASSEVRLDAGRANHSKFVSFGVNDLFEGVVPSRGDADLLREVFLVWAGGALSPLTAAWLGFPTVDLVRWLAIEPLWWDEPVDHVDRESRDVAVDDGDSFSTRTPVQPRVVLKPRGSREADG